MSSRRRRERWGWMLFVVCALVYVAAGLRDRDVLLTIGSMLFLLACVVFLLPDRPPRD